MIKMLKAYDTKFPLIVKAFEDTEIKYAFHDIDRTHSLIQKDLEIQ